MSTSSKRSQEKRPRKQRGDERPAFTARAASKRPPSALVLLVLSLAVAPAALSQSTSAGPSKTVRTLAAAESRGRELLPHELLLEQLRHDDGVLPPAGSVHPLRSLYNREAIVPAMCYTQTNGEHNPCYVCHQDRIAGRPNTMNDGDLQEAYSFSELGRKNHHRNLFEERSRRASAISDADILAWIGQDNYTELAPRLREADFKGYIPDLQNLSRAHAAFDAEGFAKDGSHWVAFNYKPLPSTFWPTNGATDDVMIRLPAPFRNTSAGAYSRDVYKANLAIVEALIKGYDSITVRHIDERVVGEDLDGDGALDMAERITKLAYVGAAKGHFSRPYLYPLGTEFLHSVRYVGVHENGRLFTPPRLKELRYMRKHSMLTEPQLYEAYLQENYAKEAGHLPGYIDRGQHGLDNELGWVIAGFIENSHGRLRFNTFEENMFCMGCHTSIGSTIDSVFSFARKIDGADGWGYIDLKGMPDAPNRGEARGEIATYLERTGGGSEFRSNPEMEARFFKDGKLDPEKLAAAKDVHDLIVPSRRRALDLDKAYRLIVLDQSYIYGRDPTVVPPATVYEQVDQDTAPTLPKERVHAWDMRLDWSRTPRL